MELELNVVRSLGLIALIVTVVWIVREVIEKLKLEEIAHDIIGNWHAVGREGFPCRLSAVWLAHEVNWVVKERKLNLPTMTEKYAEKVLLLLYADGVLQLHEIERLDGSFSHHYSIIPSAERR
jgi:hypothetical protein